MEHTRFRTVIFNETNLVLLKGKYYVNSTVPKTLAAKLGKQIRRSTSTGDKAEALRRKHDITQEIYDTYRKELRQSKFAMTERFFEYEGMKVPELDPEAIGDLTELLEWIRSKRLLGQTSSFDQDTKAIEELEVLLEGNNNTYEPETDLRTVASLYFEQRRFTNPKTKSSAETHVKDFIALVGNIDIKEVEKKHGYDFCKALDANGQASKTINTKLSSVRGLFYWCEQEGIISATPFNNMKTSNFGRSSEHYKVIPKEITKAFWKDPKVGNQERLMLACLYFTGCRIDEWATATFEMIGTDRQGFRYLDLREADVKNDNSKRMIPLHPFLDNLLGDGSDRIFDYMIDANGKATNSASKAFMKHLKAHTSDSKHVAHSYRHGLKDMLRDADVSKELNDFITGHSSGDVAGDYGSGPSLEKRYEALTKIEQDVFT